MKKWLMSTFLALIAVAFVIPNVCLCEEMSNSELMEELKALKEKIKMLEDKLNDKEVREIKEKSAEERDKLHEGSRGVKGLSDRVRRIEEKVESELLGRWSDKITLSGVIEVEAGYEDFDYDDPAEDDEKSSDITLATVELGIDVDIVKHVKGHVLFSYEDDEDDIVEEGIIIIDGEDVVPLYLNAGKLYVPFGYFGSHFISDPLTLELGETRESAVKVGFANDMFDLCAAAFNGDINEADEGDDHIENFVASAKFRLPEDTVSGLGLMVGASWISNIADSDGLQDYLNEAGTDEIKDFIPGWSAFVSACFFDKFFFEAEYVTATESFEESDLGLGPGVKFEPRAWNFELACAVTEDLEVAIRYEGSDDVLDFIPEKQYGAAFTYCLFDNTSLALEYLHGEFENDDERDMLTGQLAIEF